MGPQRRADLHYAAEPDADESVTGRATDQHAGGGGGKTICGPEHDLADCPATAPGQFQRRIRIIAAGQPRPAGARLEKVVWPELGQVTPDRARRDLELRRGGRG